MTINKKKAVMLILSLIFVISCSNIQTKKSGRRTVSTQPDSVLVNKKMDELKITQQKILMPSGGVKT